MQNKQIIENVHIEPNQTIIKPRFSEIDALSIVHHSRYIPWVEEANFNFVENILKISRRELFEMNMYNPIKKVECTYKNHITWEDKVLIKTHMYYSNFAYFIMQNKLCCYTNPKKIFAQTKVQILITDKKLKLNLLAPDFFINRIKKAQIKYPQYFTKIENGK